VIANTDLWQMAKVLILKEAFYSRVQKSIENWSVWSKMALGEVGVSLP